ncbi:MAG: HAMP domain-containing histidine kinase [Pelagibacterales bacterium]|nr:HAMP domain-containing histidine kinase [Pelagibacterales bacterium]
MTNSISQNTNRKNLLQLIWLRGIATFGQISTILFVNFYLEIELPLREMFLVLILLNILNAFSFYIYKSQKIISNNTLFIELLFDVIALSTQIYLSGGASNPFISLFLLQVIIAAILLQRIHAFLITTTTIICYVFLGFYFHELHAFHNHDGTTFNLHLHGMLLSYILSAVLLLIFVTKIIKNLQERDRKSQEEAEIIRMGLTASNAAHELSTPLTTISITLNDLKNLEFSSPQQIKDDITLMESQLTRCKKALSEILMANNKIRAEEAKIKPAKEIFDQIIKEWSSSRKTNNFSYIFEGDANKRIIFDDILTKAFFNIFDNAFEAAKSSVEILVKSSKEELVIMVKDDGKGFDEKVLKQIGKSNITTKKSNGIGLFLSINILHRVNAKVKISNLKNSKEILGALVEIKIPL